MGRLRLDVWTGVLAAALAVAAVLLAWPLAGIFAASFTDNATG